MDLRVDSTEEMVETFLTRKSSYLANADDMSVEYLEDVSGACLCRLALDFALEQRRGTLDVFADR